jgi:hypothetical protein
MLSLEEKKGLMNEEKPEMANGKQSYLCSLAAHHHSSIG